MTQSQDRYPVQQAQEAIEGRVAGGSFVLGIEGLWVDGDGVRPDRAYIADFSPDGLRDMRMISEMLQHWPRDEAFCVEILFVTPT